MWDPSSFLKKICDMVNAGRFRPNLGVPVRRERERRQRAMQAPPPRDQAPSMAANGSKCPVQRVRAMQAARQQAERGAAADGPTTAKDRAATGEPL